ncbi:beta-eliminating lyase-related protein [Arsenicicoccus piscis]|uniref:Threonine aldolase n=1 Tax=Arsenicicoccus piscis TaxID=673954 RepID=A0ABQ6HMY2_9MICO|nr:GntG family PLP-dependent aldolase [Arsenicicoccus piscis]MCH8628641.1 beta-eliminating lyase-related protein [Arsenicicoccus piscis]GMA19428.1 threonine aldolase [Arsenicicoccus piscis]
MNRPMDRPMDHAMDRPKDVVDLRSDTVTLPTAAMREAMACAPVGDDVYGEDPTVLRLQRRVADLLGHEDALFMPTGSLSNQVGLRLGVEPGQELVADSLAHVLRAELGAGAVMSGISSRTWVSRDGTLDPAEPLALMHPDAGPYLVSTALVVLENTHNFHGGTIASLESMRAVREGTAAAGVRVHLDGARLWHAHVATGVPLADYGACVDTISVCFSKGLGAPVGSMLVGSAADMARARVLRKRFGGGLRQVGVLAAAAEHALDHHVERLAQDHRRARSFAEALAATAPGSVDLERVQTNIVLVDPLASGWTAAGLVAALAERGVVASQTGPRTVRLVWHLDVDDEGTARALAACRELLTAPPVAG